MPQSTAAHNTNPAPLLARAGSGVGPSTEVKTNDVVLEAKYDDNPNPWITVKRKYGWKNRITIKTPITLAEVKPRREVTTAVRATPPLVKTKPSKKWVKKASQPQSEEISHPPSSEDDSQDASVTVTAPSETRSSSDHDRITAKKQSKRAKHSTQASLNRKTKWLAVPTGPKDPIASTQDTTATPDNTPRVQEDEPMRGPQYVIPHDGPGTTHIDNNAGRRLTVAYQEYLVPQSVYYGWRRDLGDVHPEGLGISFHDGMKKVLLPRSLVAEVGTYWVGKDCTYANYAVSQSFIRNLIRRIDFKEPELEEDALLYGSFVGFMLRASERQSMRDIIHHRSYSKKIFPAAYTAAALIAASCVPVACAAPNTPTAIAATSIVATLGLAAVGGACYVAHRIGLLSNIPLPVASPFKALSSVNSTAPDKDIRDGAKLTVHVHPTPERTNPQAARVVGVAVDGCLPTVLANNQANTVKALKKRSLAEPPPFDPETRQAAINWTIKYWPDLVGRPFHLDVPRDPADIRVWTMKWIDGCNSKPAVKAKYRATFNELEAMGINIHSEISPELLYEWTKREVSVKTETVLKDEDASPRQILAATPQFVVLIAPFVSQLTGVIKKSWDGKKKSIVYGPGQTNRKLAELVTQYDYANRFNADFNGYDLAQNHQHAEGEITVFKSYGAPRATLQLMRANIATHGASRLGVQFQCPYIRNSGDPQTTQMNTVWNGTHNAYVYCSERGIHPKDLHPETALFVAVVTMY